MNSSERSACSRVPARCLAGLVSLAAALLIPLALAAEPADPVERMGIDPAAHGVAVAVSMSTDRGKTVTPVDNEVVCQVSASKVKINDAEGSTYFVRKVLIIETEGGDTGNAIFFTNSDAWWVITDVKGPYFLVQIFQADGKESGRWLVTIS